MQGYLETTKSIYKDAAGNPQVGLCCTTTPDWQLPGLSIPQKMLQMNYGCGSTVHPRDLVNRPKNSIYVAAQNFLFNIFKHDDLRKALKEMYRVLKPRGRLILSDPISESEMPNALKNDERLRALCLSDSLPLKQYIGMIAEVGFGTIEVRPKRPYRVLDPHNYDTEELIFIESVEVCAIKDPMPVDGPCVFTGETAIYYGVKDFFDDEKGHVLFANQPLAVCDKTADALASLERDDIFISGSSFFYDGGGCC